MASPVSDRIEVALSKTKMTAMGAACLLFVALGVGLMLTDEPIPFFPKGFDSALVSNVVGGVAVAFFGLCGVLIGRKLLDHRPGLVIDHAGILDNSSGLSAGAIPWLDILGFYEYTIQGQKMVAVKLRDPEKYIARGHSMAQAVRRANYKLCGSPVTFAAGGLQIEHEALLQVLQDAARRRGIAG